MKVTKRARLCLVLLAALGASAATPAQLPPPANQPDMPIDANTRNEVLASLSRMIRDGYAFPDVADRIVKMFKEQQAHKAYDRIDSARAFGELLTRQMEEVAHDHHLRVIYSANTVPENARPAPGDSPIKPDSVMQRALSEQQRNNYGFEKVERLRGNVGYLKFNEFVDVAPAWDRAVTAMGLLADTDALIIDLQDNHGGGPIMVQLLASYFFGGEEPVHLNDLIFRKPGTREEEVVQRWTVPYVPGKKYLDKEIYILTGRGTFSAAEEFVYDLQTRKRAVVVGEMTAGGANINDFRRLADHYIISISIAHSTNPITRTNWEGKGIQPDVAVARNQALPRAYRQALQHLLERTQDERAEATLRQALGSLDTDSTDAKY